MSVLEVCLTCSKRSCVVLARVIIMRVCVSSCGNDGALRNSEFCFSFKKWMQHNRNHMVTESICGHSCYVRFSGHSFNDCTCTKEVILSINKKSMLEYNLTVFIIDLTTSKVFAAHIYGIYETLNLGNYSMKSRTAAVLWQ